MSTNEVISQGGKLDQLLRDVEKELECESNSRAWSLAIIKALILRLKDDLDAIEYAGYMYTHASNFDERMSTYRIETSFRVGNKFAVELKVREL